jgi:hypothetical protein
LLLGSSVFVLFQFHHVGYRPQLSDYFCGEFLPFGGKYFQKIYFVANFPLLFWEKKAKTEINF